MENYTIIFTKKQQPIIIDNADYDLVKDYSWHICDGYACTNMIINGKRFYKSMHSLIMNTQSGQKVDHKNRIRNDNRRSNLRFVTNSENSINKHIPNTNKSGVVGVNWNKKLNKWTAQIQISGNKMNLGYFTSIEDAITARKEAEDKYFGEFRPTI